MWRGVLSLWLLAVACFSRTWGQSSDYPLCDSGSEIAIGSGLCTTSNNNEECGWDGGDCCECDCVDATFTCGSGAYDCQDPDSLCYGDSTTGDDFYDSSDDYVIDDDYDTDDDYPFCDGDTSIIASGACTSANNNEECGWDGGDCCECDCVDATSECGSLGYDCQDPDSLCYGDSTTGDDFYDSSDDYVIDDDYDTDDDYPFCDGDTSIIGSGACTSANNNEECGWDGGDCCECDCVSDALDCGSIGYDCQDPTSTCYEGDSTYTSGYYNYDDDATPSPTAPFDDSDDGAYSGSPVSGATMAPLAGDENGDGLVNSADTGIVGDTNGDGVVDDEDTGLVGDTNGDGVVNDADEVVAGVSEDGSGDDDDFPLGIVIGCAAAGVLLLGAIVACVLFKTGHLKACSCCYGSKPAVATGTQNAVPAPHSASPAPPPPAYTSPTKGSSAVDRGFDTAGDPSASTHPPPPPPPPAAGPSPSPPAYDEPSSAAAPTAAPPYDTTRGPPAASAPPPPPPAFSDYHNTLPPSYQE